MDKRIRARQKEYGQSMIELALTITFLMVLLAGTIDLGHAFFTWLSMRDAAQEGASYASIVLPKPNSPLSCPSTSTDQICLRVWDNLDQVIRDTNAVVNVTITFSGDKCLGGANPGPIEVVVEYTNFPITTPFLGTIIGDTIKIRATIKDDVIVPMCG